MVLAGPTQPGVPAMVAARRMVRRHFGRDHHPFIERWRKSLPR